MCPDWWLGICQYCACAAAGESMDGNARACLHLCAWGRCASPQQNDQHGGSNTGALRPRAAIHSSDTPLRRRRFPSRTSFCETCRRPYGDRRSRFPFYQSVGVGSIEHQLASSSSPSRNRCAALTGFSTTGGTGLRLIDRPTTVSWFALRKLRQLSWNQGRSRNVGTCLGLTTAKCR